MRSLVIFALGCFLAGSLTACSGRHAAGTSVMPQSTQSAAQKPTGKGRHTHSGCTPDSYGYCVVMVSRTLGERIYCGGWVPSTITVVYELYYNNVDQGTYTYYYTDYGCDPQFTWDPGDPAVVTGDPNLP
jgi:hypothetical protein